jgi:hypothetical protein
MSFLTRPSSVRVYQFRHAEFSQRAKDITRRGDSSSGRSGPEKDDGKISGNTSLKSINTGDSSIPIPIVCRKKQTPAESPESPPQLFLLEIEDVTLLGVNCWFQNVDWLPTDAGDDLQIQHSQGCLSRF